MKFTTIYIDKGKMKCFETEKISRIVIEPDTINVYLYGGGHVSLPLRQGEVASIFFSVSPKHCLQQSRK
jgi:hypothetical protein